MRQRFCPRQVERRSNPGSLRFGSTRSRIGLIRASSSRTGPARGNAVGNAKETLRPTRMCRSAAPISRPTPQRAEMPDGNAAKHPASRARKGQKPSATETNLQARYPELVMRVDYDPAQATATRRNFLERYCDTTTLFCTMHFPSPSVGHIKRWETVSAASRSPIS